VKCSCNMSLTSSKEAWNLKQQFLVQVTDSRAGLSTCPLCFIEGKQPRLNDEASYEKYENFQTLAKKPESFFESS